MIHKRHIIPGILLVCAAFAFGLAAAVGVSRLHNKQQTILETAVIPGTTVTHGVTVKVPRSVVRTKDHTVIIPAHQVTVSRTQLLSSPTRTVNGTVFRTVTLPVTVPGTTVTGTTTVLQTVTVTGSSSTVTGPTTTIISGTTITETVTDTVTTTLPFS